MPELRSAYRLRSIFATAWAVARSAARRFNAPVRSFFAASLKQAWAQAKDTAGMRARVLGVVANLAAEAAEMERLTVEGAVRLGLPGYRRAAEVLPFPSRRPVVPAAPARRAA